MSKPAELKALKAAVLANRRLLALLDNDLAEASLVDPDLVNLDPDQSLSFTYAAMDGGDGLAGIDISTSLTGVSNPHYGILRTDGDAAFVCTSMSAYVETFYDIDGSGADHCFIDAATAASRFGVGVRLLDDTSGRRLSLVYSASAMPWQSAVIPIDVLGQCSFGSVGGLLNPAECTFPRNTTIRIDAFKGVSTGDSERLYILFHGYKVLGG